MKFEIVKCDGCKKILETGDKIYHLVFESERFFDGVETTENAMKLDFCKKCVLDIKQTLKKILERNK